MLMLFGLCNESEWGLEAVKLQIRQNPIKLVHTSPKYFEDAYDRDGLGMDGHLNHSFNK